MGPLNTAPILATGPLGAIGGVSGLLARLPTIEVGRQIHALDILAPHLSRQGASFSEVNKIAYQRTMMRRTPELIELSFINDALNVLEANRDKLEALNERSYEDEAHRLAQLIEGSITPDLDATWAADPEPWDGLPENTQNLLRAHYRIFAMPSLLPVNVAYHAACRAERISNLTSFAVELESLRDEPQFFDEGEWGQS